MERVCAPVGPGEEAATPEPHTCFETDRDNPDCSGGKRSARRRPAHLKFESPLALKLKIEERVPPELSEREHGRSTGAEE